MNLDLEGMLGPFPHFSLVLESNPALNVFPPFKRIPPTPPSARIESLGSELSLLALEKLYVYVMR